MYQHHVVLYDKTSGENIVHQLTQGEELSGPLCSDKSDEVFTDDVSEMMSALKNPTDYSVTENYVQEFLYAIMKCPNSTGALELSLLCQLLPQCMNSLNITAHLLRLICGIMLFSEKVKLSELDLDRILNCLTSDESGIMELTLLLLKAVFSVTRDLLYSADCVHLLCSSLHKWKGSSIIIEHILDLILLIGTKQQFGTDTFSTSLDMLFDESHQFSCSSAASIVQILNRCVHDDSKRFSPRYFEPLFIYTADVMISIGILNILEALAKDHKMENLAPLQLNQPMLVRLEFLTCTLLENFLVHPIAADMECDQL